MKKNNSISRNISPSRSESLQDLFTEGKLIFPIVSVLHQMPVFGIVNEVMLQEKSYNCTVSFFWPSQQKLPFPIHQILWLVEHTRGHIWVKSGFQFLWEHNHGESSSVLPARNAVSKNSDGCRINGVCGTNPKSLGVPDYCQVGSCHS